MRPLVLAIVLGFQLQKQLRLMSPPSQDPGAFGYDSSGVSELRTAFLMLYEPCSWCNCCVALLSHHHETDRERERETERECEKRSQLSKSDTTGRGGETRHQRNKSKRKPAKHNGRGGWRAGPRTEEQARGTWHKGAANLWGSRRQDTSTCWGHKSPTSLKGSHRQAPVR